MTLEIVLCSPDATQGFLALVMSGQEVQIHPRGHESVCEVTEAETRGGRGSWGACASEADLRWEERVEGVR